MSKRGLTQKHVLENQIVLERPMVTRHYKMIWDLDKCIGCQLGPLCCPKEAIQHVEGRRENGRLVQKPSVDINADKCVFCGICEVMCPKHAILIKINGEWENPALKNQAWPLLQESTLFHKDSFNWDRKEFVITNCPTNVISEDAKNHNLIVDDANCIRCRQCEIASDGAFQVTQPWQGNVTLQREKCLPDCLACADICPTRALSIDEKGQLILADYYCIKCGACMQVCPVKSIFDEYEVAFTSQNVTKTVKHKKITNFKDLPIYVERWRIRHESIQSGAWVEGLLKMADERAEMIEMDSKRALKRKDLLTALLGGREILEKGK
jgi:formate hydrogenlyase subunit 6/NADH:ubiquinone oxidoreductase subunit I